MTDQLRSIYSRWQNLEADKAAISEDLKELFAESKSNGFDPKALRIAFRLKAAAEGPKAHEVAETASLVEVYVAALGGEEVVIPSRERARVPREDRATQIGTHVDSGEVLSLGGEQGKDSLGARTDRPRRGGRVVSLPNPMDCLAERCPAPTSCQHRGECAARRQDSARSYEEAIAACRQSGRIPDAWRDRG